MIRVMMGERVEPVQLSKFLSFPDRKNYELINEE